MVRYYCLQEAYRLENCSFLLDPKQEGKDGFLCTHYLVLDGILLLPRVILQTSAVWALLWETAYSNP